MTDDNSLSLKMTLNSKHHRGEKLKTKNQRYRNTKNQVETCNFIKKETLVEVFSYEFCEIFQHIFSYRTPTVATSVHCSTKNLVQIITSVRCDLLQMRNKKKMKKEQRRKQRQENKNITTNNQTKTNKKESKIWPKIKARSNFTS